MYRIDNQDVQWKEKIIEKQQEKNYIISPYCNLNNKNNIATDPTFVF